MQIIISLRHIGWALEIMNLRSNQCETCHKRFVGISRKRMMLTHMITKHYKKEFNKIMPPKVGEYYSCNQKDCTFKSKIRSNFLQHLGITHNLIQNFHLGIPVNLEDSIVCQPDNVVVQHRMNVTSYGMNPTRKVILSDGKLCLQRPVDERETEDDPSEDTKDDPSDMTNDDPSEETDNYPTEETEDDPSIETGDEPVEELLDTDESDNEDMENAVGKEPLLSQHFIEESIDDPEDLNAEDLSAFDADNIVNEAQIFDQLTDKTSDNLHKDNTPEKPKQEQLKRSDQSRTPVITLSSIMGKVYEILKSVNIEYNIVVAAKKTIFEKEGISFLEIYNSLAEKSFIFFSSLHLIIYEKNGALFMKIFYQQRKLIKERRIFDVDVNQVDLKAIIIDFLQQVSPGNFKECQGSLLLGSVEKAETIFIELTDSGVVYRSRECQYLVKSNDKYKNQVCQPCMKLFFSSTKKNDFKKTVLVEDNEPVCQPIINVPPRNIEEHKIVDNLQMYPDQNGQAKPSKLRKAKRTSYKDLIVEAILQYSDKKAKLSEIYERIFERYPMLKENRLGIQNSIRHNLSIGRNKVFKREDDMGKGGVWSLVSTFVHRPSTTGRCLDTTKDDSMLPSPETESSESMELSNEDSNNHNIDHNQSSADLYTSLISDALRQCPYQGATFKDILRKIFENNPLYVNQKELIRYYLTRFEGKLFAKETRRGATYWSFMLSPESEPKATLQTSPPNTVLDNNHSFQDLINNCFSNPIQSSGDYQDKFKEQSDDVKCKGNMPSVAIFPPTILSNDHQSLVEKSSAIMQPVYSQDSLTEQSGADVEYQASDNKSVNEDGEYDVSMTKKIIQNKENTRILPSSPDIESNYESEYEDDPVMEDETVHQEINRDESNDDDPITQMKEVMEECFPVSIMDEKNLRIQNPKKRRNTQIESLKTKPRLIKPASNTLFHGKSIFESQKLIPNTKKFLNIPEVKIQPRQVTTLHPEEQLRNCVAINGSKIVFTKNTTRHKSLL